ncbi:MULTISPECIES: hypothetical protein [unclassified Streptomyces]|uniref:hypothetical protein n=1 Tax=unclassified Streptomyces TaxID=2593676 RepID=UPI0037FBC332
MYEPNDVTVELDGLGRQLSELPAGTRPEAASGIGTAGTGTTTGIRTGGGTGTGTGTGIGTGFGPGPGPGSGTGIHGIHPDGAADAAEAPEGPVFVDESGRRSKKLRRAGWVIAIACACYAVTVVAALLGGDSSAPWLQIPGLADKKKPDTVQIQPAATTSPTAVAPSADPSAPPAATDTGGAVAPRTSDAVTSGVSGDPAPGASNSVAPPVASDTPGRLDPDPGVSDDTGAGSGAGSAGAGGPTPTDTASGVSSPPADPSPPVETPSVDDGGQLAVEGAQ